MLYSFSILYLTINENISSGNEGVSKKLISKVVAIQKICPNCILLNASINLSHNNINVFEKNEFLINMEIGVKEANAGYLNKINSDKLFYKKLAEYIEKNNLNFDRFIFRYPFATSGLKYFTKHFNKKIIFEHNSKETEELYLNIKNKNYANFNIRPSSFFYWYQEKRYPMYAERKLAPKIMKYAYAGSCVTSEIAEYEKQRNPGYKTFVSSNFYDVASVTVSKIIYNKAEELLSIGMIVTTSASWYGLDRIIRSFVSVQKKYKLIIAGIDQNDLQITKLLTENNIKENIYFLGKLSKEQLTSFYNSVHICFGSLGLYTINLNYASTLKVKESVAFGIPVVVGYNEEDFIANKEFLPYYLQIPNNNSLIDFETIERFTSGFYADAENKNKLRALALKYMDVNVKMKNLLENIKPV